MQGIYRNSFVNLEKRIDCLILKLLLDAFHLNILPSQKEPVKPVRHKHGLTAELPLQVPPFLQGSELQTKLVPRNKMTQLTLTQKAVRHKIYHSSTTISFI